MAAVVVLVVQPKALDTMPNTAEVVEVGVGQTPHQQAAQEAPAYTAGVAVVEAVTIMVLAVLLVVGVLILREAAKLVAQATQVKQVMLARHENLVVGMAVLGAVVMMAEVPLEVAEE